MSVLKWLLHKLVQMLQLLLRKGSLVHPPRTTCHPGKGWDMTLGSGFYDKFIPNTRPCWLKQSCPHKVTGCETT